jgi:hypothetical protein
VSVGVNEQLLREHDAYLREERVSCEQYHARRLWACFELARDVDAFAALWEGRPVPRHRLNQALLARLGR